MESNIESSAAMYSNTKMAGWIIGVIALLEIIIMAHHPTGSSSAGNQQFLNVIHLTDINGFVHGSLITLIILSCAVFIIYSMHRGINKLIIIIALLAYGIGIVAMSGAALINGFIVPATVGQYLSTFSNNPDQLAAIRIFSWQSNQALANFGVYAMSAAIVLWSIELFGRKRFNQLTSIFGLLVGVAVILTLTGGWIQLDVAGMLTVVIAQSIWYCCIAAILIRE